MFYIKLLSLNLETFECEIEVKVSKGTYIRSLVNDIGEYLGCKAALKELRRISVLGFSDKECISLDNLNKDNIKEHISSAENAVSYMPEVFVTEKQAVRFSNGGALSLDRLKNSDIKAGEFCRVKYQNIFLGVGFSDGELSELKVKCVIDTFKREED